MIADIHCFNLFKHMNFPNLYEMRKVCSFCYAMYHKIDAFRVTKKNSNNIFLKDKTLIQKEIERVMADTNANMMKKMKKEKKIFSQTFYKEFLPQAYKPINKKIQPLVPNDLLGRYEKKMIKRQKIKETRKRNERREAIANGGGLPSVNANKNDQLSLRFH